MVSSANQSWNADSNQSASAPANTHRRRGSVLVLVMTLLGVLFVTGVAFMATMNFESELIAVDRLNQDKAAGVKGTIDTFSRTLLDARRPTSINALTGPLLSRLAGAIPADPPFPTGTFAELPGYRSFISPIEPYFRATTPPIAGAGDVVFPWVTDLQRLFGDPSVPPYGFDQTINVEQQIGAVVDPADDSFRYVDADGDGIVDSIQVPVKNIGFSRTSMAKLAPQLNPKSNPGGDLFIALRIIPHGAMVNLNDSHPQLIANALNLPVDTPDVLANPAFYAGNPGFPDLRLGSFRHGPSQQPDNNPYFYSPQQEEAALRHRFLIPPKSITPSLVHGNPTLKPTIEPFGQSDFATRMYAPSTVNPDFTTFGRVFADEHRFMPYAFNQYTPLGDQLVWAIRAEPESSFNFDVNGHHYDRRHLVTTISHDALVSRGGRYVGVDAATGDEINVDLLDRMREANFAAHTGVCNFVLPFEYPNYPPVHPDLSPQIEDKTRVNPLGVDCDCPTLDESICRFDPRNGRMLLSLPWLDLWENQAKEEALSVTPQGLKLAAAMRGTMRRIIYDTFMMLVRNATGAYWEDIDCSVNASLCEANGETCLPVPQPTCTEGPNDGRACTTNVDCPSGSCVTNLCHDQITRQRHRLALISRTAASLTANMIDYMDFDDENADGIDDNTPTRIALRSFDFSDPTTAGWEFGDPAGPPGITAIPVQYVYGLERQPYITEVAVTTDGIGIIEARAVELFNPYGVTLLGADYMLVEVNGGIIQTEIDITEDLLPLSFTVFQTESSDEFKLKGTGKPPGKVYNASTDLDFEEGWTIYLVRRATYPPAIVSDSIVVDQFTFGRATFGAVAPLPILPIFSTERVASLGAPWTAPVPLPEHQLQGGHTLGNWNVQPNSANIRPVEVNFANTGSFSDIDILELQSNTAFPQKGRAFPTTGSMLLLMRHANRAMSDLTWTEDLAFTTWLDDTTSVPDPFAPPPATLNVEEHTQVDNGRMPVFDLGKLVPDPSGIANPRQVFVHHADPASTVLNEPGGLDTLPWGQLVFDYFTAVPLANPGPFRNPTGDPGFTPGQPASQPRVDQDGLRVHGRINLNAAPWTVLSHLPVIPMLRMPLWVRAKITLAAVPGGTPDDQASIIFEPMAQGIVAYREARRVPDLNNFEDYGNGMPAVGSTVTVPYGRGWATATVNTAARRGMGFLTIGELANVRHTGTSDPDRRIDRAELDAPIPDFVTAIAVLASLGDWVTVRSDVFTVYGVLRGDVDPDIGNPFLQQRDIDTRAVRFQETIDRLPAFMGRREVVRVGERVVAPYQDILNN